MSLSHRPKDSDLERIEAERDRLREELAEANEELSVLQAACDHINRELTAAKMDYSDEIAVKDAESKALVSTIKELVDLYPNLFPRICECCGKSL